MNSRERILVFSIVVMAGGMLCAAAVAIATLYRTAFEEERMHLVEIARVQARFVEAAVRHDEMHGAESHPEGSVEADVLSQIGDARQAYAGLGDTGEFLLARRDGEAPRSKAHARDRSTECHGGVGERARGC